MAARIKFLIEFFSEDGKSVRIQEVKRGLNAYRYLEFDDAIRLLEKRRQSAIHRVPGRGHVFRLVLKQNARARLPDPYCFPSQGKKRKKAPTAWFLERRQFIDAGQHEGFATIQPWSESAYWIDQENALDQGGPSQNSAPLVLLRLPLPTFAMLPFLRTRPMIHYGALFMKLWKHSNFLFLCAAGLFLAASTLLAQLSDIPVKAGLWGTHVTVKAGPSNVSDDAQYCFSAGTTLGDYLTATNRSIPGTTCNTSNKINTAHGVSYDTVCSGGSMGSKGHIDFQLTDAEHFSGTSHTTVTGASQGKSVNMVVDKTFNAKFLGADCGSVKPLVVPSSPKR
jgi:hypothetical protein